MDNSLNATEIAVGSLLAGRNGGYGGMGGAWGGGYGGYGPFASPTANAVRLNRNAKFIENQADCTRELLGEGLDSINNSFENATRAAEFTTIREGQFQSELRTNDRLQALQAEMNANARVAAQCCCDLKLQACQDKSELKSEILAVETRNIQRDLDRAERALESRNVIDAITTRCGCCPSPA